MCGIAGVINSSGVEERDVENMILKIRYRGVDEADTKELGRAVIGHARLAIVDIENGKQPMSNTDDSVWVTFNGEIYNYVELRAELKKKGYVFKSRCDTEVLVHLWREEGEKMLSRLVGMFAFFIWDTRYDRGILARDRQGIKPCFIADYKGGTAFCSEIKGLLNLPDFAREINDEALKQVFCFNYPLPPATCFKGITHLDPGCYLLFEGAGQPVKKRYWEWPFLEQRQDLKHEEFARMIDDALMMQMRFDVNGGLYLSGGVDSSVVASHLVKHWNREVIDAVGLKFSDPAFSEYHYSQEVASLLGIHLGEAKIDLSVVPDTAPDVCYHAEQPHGDFSFFLFYTLARSAHRENKIVMFSGDGPDEFMGGFTHNEAFFFHGSSRIRTCRLL